MRYAEKLCSNYTTKPEELSPPAFILRLYSGFIMPLTKNSPEHSGLQWYLNVLRSEILHHCSELIIRFISERIFREEFGFHDRNGFAVLNEYDIVNAGICIFGIQI